MKGSGSGTVLRHRDRRAFGVTAIAVLITPCSIASVALFDTDIRKRLVYILDTSSVTSRY